MLQSEPALLITTDEALAVVNVLPIWKTNCAFELPWSLRVSVPVSCADDAKDKFSDRGTVIREDVLFGKIISN